jgi:hypothetical protein
LLDGLEKLAIDGSLVPQHSIHGWTEKSVAASKLLLFISEQASIADRLAHDFLHKQLFYVADRSIVFPDLLA